MRFPALFDTNVLYGALLNDLILELADRGPFRPLRSQDVLFELAKNLVKNDEEDRHVLAAAVRGGAEVLVAFNLKDFPASSVERFDLEIVHPDDFLLDQLDLYHATTLRALVELVESYDSPAMTMDDYLIALIRAGVPKFAETARDRLY
ncbi:PIN domain-containing protein [Leucobacter sp. wl10]|nr:PIN domain-containing protein [Leucobacter sp. wl10]